MTHRCHGSCIRGTTLTSLITEQTSLDALYHRNTQHSAGSLIEAEGILHNGKQHLRQTGDIPNHDSNGYQKIDDSHHRNHSRRELCHALDTTEDDEQGEHREHNSHGSRFDAERFLPGQTDGIALNRIIGKAKGNDHQDGKENAHPSLSKTILHIVGRTSKEGCFSPALVKLG